jgi:hypothetical protein
VVYFCNFQVTVQCKQLLIGRKFAQLQNMRMEPSLPLRKTHFRIHTYVGLGVCAYVISIMMAIMVRTNIRRHNMYILHTYVKESHFLRK